MNYNKPGLPRPNFAGKSIAKSVVYTTVNDKKIVIQRTAKRKLRPEPFVVPSTDDGFEQKIVKTSLLKALFVSSPLTERAKAPTEKARDCECVVFQYSFKTSNKRMLFIPCHFDVILPKEYACRDCFRVYALLSIKQRDLNPLPTLNPKQLKPTFDPRTLPHYCLYFKAFCPEINYFNEFEPQLDNNCNVSLVDLSFVFGMFMSRMAETHRKVTNFINSSKPKTLQQLTKYIVSLNLALKNETQALSFLHAFSLLHTHNKQPPLLDEKELLFKLLATEPERAAPAEAELNCDEVLDWKQIKLQEFDDDADGKAAGQANSLRYKLDRNVHYYHPPKFRVLPYKITKPTSARNRQSAVPKPKPKPIPTDEELAATINHFVASTNSNVTTDSFEKSVKQIRMLVLYYAPSRASEFDRIAQDVLMKIEPNFNAANAR